MHPSARSSELKLRQFFKYLNRLMLLMWRLGIGPWRPDLPEALGHYLILTHTGRKSGLKYQTPVNYAVVDGEIYISAGFGTLSDWFRNIQANPQVEIWLAEGRWNGKAVEVTGAEQRLRLLRQVLIGSGFAAGLFGGLDPHTIPDAELERLTQDYRLIHLQRSELLPGLGEFASLAWVWPTLVTGLLVALSWRRRR